MPRICLLLALTAFLVGCAPDKLACDDEAGAAVSASLNVSVDVESIAPDTRSEIGGSDEMLAFEGAVNNLTVFQFDEDGSLYRSYYFPSVSEGLYVQGRSGRKYRFLATANIGDCRPKIPAGSPESAMDDLVFSTYGISWLPSSGGCPMVCHPEEGESRSLDMPVTVTLCRLLSRYDFSIEQTALKHGTFKAYSVSVLQSCSKVYPFRRRSRAETSSDLGIGDRLSRTDLALLNEGGTVGFYCMENAQGVLLPSNRDPWAKVPSMISDRSDLCTYLEVKGFYSTDDNSYMVEHTYRMYLGADNVTDFNILRGRGYRLKLVLEENGALDPSWKLERNIRQDTRIFDLTPDSCSVRYKETATVGVRGNISAADCTFILSENLVSAGVSFDSGTMCLSLGKKLDRPVTGTLRAVSWDGARTDSCSVTALEYKYKVTMKHHYNWTTESNQEEIYENVLEEWVTFDVEDHLKKETGCQFNLKGMFEGFLTSYGSDYLGVVRVTGNPDKPPYQMTPNFLRAYPVSVRFDSETYTPSWDDITIKFP